MKSKSYTISELFKPRRQFRVPFYQRTYKWGQLEQWEPLWEDIKAKAEARAANVTPTPHFLGAVVIQPHEDDSINEQQGFDIIDGQQRLTTLQYVLLAIRIAHHELDLTVPASVGACIANIANDDEQPCTAEERPKVWPTFTDRSQHLKTMEASNLQALQSAYPAHFTRQRTLYVHDATRPPSLGAVWYFASKFIAWMDENDRDTAKAGAALADAVLKDLQVVYLKLEPHDDPQVIFETLNGRGARLTAIDLIRNLIFMRADGEEDSDPKALYEKHWLRFEDKDWTQMERRGRLSKPRLEWMVRTMLETVTHQEVDQQRLYNGYKDFALSGLEGRRADDQLAMLNEFGNHYAALVSGAGSLPIARFGQRIQAYEATTVYPLALMVSTSNVDDAEKAAMYADLISYLVRRATCGLTSKNYNTHFFSGLKHLSREGVSAKELRRFLATSKGEASRWPLDGEFRRALLEAPVYHGRLAAPPARQLLTELEGELRRARRTEEPEIPNLSYLDIDHLMPQQWPNHWPLVDGTTVSSLDVQNAQNASRAGLELTCIQKAIMERQALVHTLGNLTLLNLSVNRSAQNKEFAIKQDLLIRHTNLSLNVQLIQLPDWTVDRIRARASVLADAALRLYPGLPDEVAAKAEVADEASQVSA